MVKIYVGVTDGDWFEYLSQRQPDEVNFWAPSGGKRFHVISPGELFLFKLHAPRNFIVGGGIFSHATSAPVSLAWDAFGPKNGTPTLDDMRTRIAKYRRQPPGELTKSDPVIGCRILTDPFFWPEELWFPVPESWSSNIVSGKHFNTEDAEGAALWSAVMDRAVGLLSNTEDSPSRYGAPQLVQPRLGQGAFRLQVTDAYDRRCAVSGERTLPILDAAHIRSYAAGGDHRASNGLLLRTDIHRLFDLGYVTVDEDHRFVVSGRLKADFDNGKHYYDLHGSAIRRPILPDSAPAADDLSWHREHRYLG